MMAVAPDGLGEISPEQQAGIDAIRKAGEGRLKGHVAYVLATAWHETGGRMQPVREGFADTDEEAARIVTQMWASRRIKKNYAAREPNGKSYYGRGLVQLTWRDSYRRIGQRLGIHQLEHDPDLALQPDIAIRILWEGMSRGLFTGRCLGDFINSRGTDFYQARRIINGLDRATLVAGYAEAFLKAIEDFKP